MPFKNGLRFLQNQRSLQRLSLKTTSIIEKRQVRLLIQRKPTGLLTQTGMLVMISLNLPLLLLDQLSLPLLFSNQLKNSMVPEYSLTVQSLNVSLISPTMEFPALSVIPLTELLSLTDHAAPLESIAQVMHTLAGKTVLITSSQLCKHSHLLMDPQSLLSLQKTSYPKRATEPPLEL